MLKITLKILSLKGSLFEDKVDMVVVPGLLGDIGIIAGERLFTYLLKPGIVYLFKNNKVVKRYFVINGRFKAEDNLVIINTEFDVYDLDELNTEEVSKLAENYKQKMETAKIEETQSYYKDQYHAYELLLQSKDVNHYK